jgi:hypothetical protein
MSGRISRPFFIRTLWLAIGSVAIVGCGDNDDGRLALQGNVSVNGSPVDASTLILTPNSPGVVPVSARVERGQFAFTKETGPYPGEYTVRINRDEASIEEIIQLASGDPRRAAKDIRELQQSTVQDDVNHATATVRIIPDQGKRLSINLTTSSTY